MEDLASRGYIALAVDHTYEGTAVEFSDGRLVRSLVGSHLGGEVTRDRKTLSFAVDVRLKDLDFVIDQIGRLNVRRDGPFLRRFDLSKIAVAGHSLGGLTALLTNESNPHVKSAILLDPVLPDLLPKCDQQTRSTANSRQATVGHERVRLVEQSARLKVCRNLARQRARGVVRLDLAHQGRGPDRANGSGKDNVCHARLHRSIPGCQSSWGENRTVVEWTLTELSRR